MPYYDRLTGVVHDKMEEFGLAPDVLGVFMKQNRIMEISETLRPIVEGHRGYTLKELDADFKPEPKPLSPRKPFFLVNKRAEGDKWYNLETAEEVVKLTGIKPEKIEALLETGGTITHYSWTIELHYSREALDA